MMMITGISVQCGAVHCRTGSAVDITRMSVDNHPYLRRLLVSIIHVLQNFHRRLLIIQLLCQQRLCFTALTSLVGYLFVLLALSW